MKRFISFFSFILSICCNLPAQITFSPSSLTWASGERDGKVVIVHSSGHWETDSTSFNNHFTFSKYDGYDGDEITIAPRGRNSGGSSIIFLKKVK